MRESETALCVVHVAIFFACSFTVATATTTTTAAVTILQHDYQHFISSAPPRCALRSSIVLGRWFGCWFVKHKRRTKHELGIRNFKFRYLSVGLEIIK